MAVTEVRNITSSQIEGYFHLTGWFEEARFDDGYASVWHRNDDDLAEVVLPLNSESGDYEPRLLDALNAVARFENRSVSTLAAAISDIGADIVRVRVVHGDVNDGSIPLQEGVELNERARDMMLAAAMASVQKKKIFLGSRGDITLGYMKSLRLGQTSVGSYVVNVIAPIPPHSNELPTVKPFARVVTENLADSLVALSDAASTYEDTSDLSVFDESVSRGVSANMCEAILGMSGRHRQRSVVVSVVASPNIPNELPVASIRFNVSQFDAIETAAEYLKGDYILPDRTIRGYVKRLDREHGIEEGSVSITAVLFGKNEKHVSVALKPREYAEAIRAHEKGFVVEIHGDIHVTPRTATMLNASGFRVFENGDLFD